jgi:hypothetical protein
LAAAEGLLSVDDRVISFFPDETPAEVSDNLAAMRVHDLLSMGTGHADDTMLALWMQPEGKWVKAFLECPVTYAPGTHFLYNTGATYMLSAIVQKVTGTMLLDYLTPRLLEPLDIRGATWEVSPEGIHAGGFGMNITTEDIANFGQMYLQKGMWQGKRILSEAWIEQATRKQIDNGSDPSSDWNQGYGYQFWRCRHNAYRGDGAFGQYCIVMPEQDAVLAMTGGLYDMQAVMNLAWDCLLPAMSASALPEDAANFSALQSKQTSLAMLPPSGGGYSPMAVRVTGRTFKADANALDIETVSLKFGQGSCTVTTTVNGSERRLTCGYSEWVEGKGVVLNDLPVLTRGGLPDAQASFVASGVWTAEDTFRLTCRFYETPYYTTTIFRFGGDHVEIETNINVAFVAQNHKFVARLA